MTKFFEAEYQGATGFTPTGGHIRAEITEGYTNVIGKQITIRIGNADECVDLAMRILTMAYSMTHPTFYSHDRRYEWDGDKGQVFLTERQPGSGIYVKIDE